MQLKTALTDRYRGGHGVVDGATGGSRAGTKSKTVGIMTFALIKTPGDLTL